MPAYIFFFFFFDFFFFFFFFFVCFRAGHAQPQRRCARRVAKRCALRLMRAARSRHYGFRAMMRVAQHAALKIDAADFSDYFATVPPTALCLPIPITCLHFT